MPADFLLLQLAASAFPQVLSGMCCMRDNLPCSRPPCTSVFFCSRTCFGQPPTDQHCWPGCLLGEQPAQPGIAERPASIWPHYHCKKVSAFAGTGGVRMSGTGTESQTRTGRQTGAAARKGAKEQSQAGLPGTPGTVLMVARAGMLTRLLPRGHLSDAAARAPLVTGTLLR